ncbi:indolepyruvate oxidoreductase subunit beta [Desulfovibrio intestinalis]|uniref:Indolepyruvate ferredoxin oxidoreductase beta subunit n=1 Tax=Desulfovibrio intestinalis TaxID=58621 RepID=A0A7W8FGR5_9BACT|nr:indolepyruvate oxidoreductase subunit beta [Desulfovibrio intestinalis]MBB5143057.1 indolepyruvate ferredoxin oxidoreductase beta subunit [Desulfovibrio intestinalis]
MTMQNNQKRMRVYFTGVGGQGTLTATTLLARTALEAGLEVVAGEVHGMAQRGGVVESVMLLGGWRSPKLDLGEADVMLGFEPLETLRGLPYLKKGGAVFSSSDPMPPVSVSLGKAEYPAMNRIKASVCEVAGVCHFIPCRELGIQAGSVQSGNTVLLSAVCASGVLPFGVDALEEAIKKFLPAKLQEVNLKALELGKTALKG